MPTTDAALNRGESDDGASSGIDRQPTPRPRKKKVHVARGSRIVTTGLGLSSMFATMAALGSSGPATAGTTPPELPPQQETIVVVHHLTGRSEASDARANTVSDLTASSTDKGTVTLQAKPVVRTVQASPQAAPIARTNGSR